MKIIDILSMSYTTLVKLSKNRLLIEFQYLREKYIKLEEKNNELKAENDKLKKNKIKSVNRNANKPSSKQPEWDEKGVGNDGKGKKKGKGRGKKPRKGAGNRPKNHLLPTGQKRLRSIFVTCSDLNNRIANHQFPGRILTCARFLGIVN